MVLLCSLCSFVLWTLIISDPVYETPPEIVHIEMVLHERKLLWHVPTQ